MNQTNLTFGERGARRSHHILHAALVHGNDVRVAFHQIGAAGTHNGGLGLKKPIEFPTFGVDWAFGRVDILCQLFVRAKDSATEGNDLAADGVNGENHTTVEAVNQFVSVCLVAQPRQFQILVTESCRLCRLRHGGALRGTETERKLVNDVVSETSRAKIAHAQCHAVHVRFENALKIFCSPCVQGKHVLSHTLQLSFLVCFLFFANLDTVFCAQPFDGFGIGHLFNLHEEVHDVSAFSAREALAELLGGRNDKTRCLFLVERTQTFVVHTGFAKCDKLFDDIDNVCGIKNASNGFLFYHEASEDLREIESL